MTYFSTLAPLGLVVALAALQTPAANQAYERGRQALDRGSWHEAIEAFGAASEDQALADAGLYWQAYAYSKIPDARRALELVASLESRYPKSAWLDDARALAAEMRGGSARDASSDDEDLKLMALNGLLRADEAEAIPILEELLTSEKSGRLKERALFVLAQSESEKAREILARVAKGEGDPELQRQAVRYLGVHGSDRGLALLAELYESLSSTEARAAVLESFMIADEKKKILDVATNEPNPELRGRAIQLLGAMNATDELWELYQRETNADVKRKLLEAFMIAGDQEHLQLVASDKAQPPENRMAAIEFLGVSGDEATPALLGLYRGETDREVKGKVLEALFINGAVKELIEIARAESDPELKRAAIEKISLTGSPEAKDFLLSILRTK